MVISINEGLLADIPIFETDISEKPDGVYSGSYSTSGYSAAVNVTISSGYILDVEIAALERLSPTRAAMVKDMVVKYQMLNFEDPGWSPQPSDRVLLKAVERALTNSATAAM